MTDKKQTPKTVFLKATLLDCIKGAIYLLLYFAFLYWVGSWWGLLAAPLIFDVYFTKYIKWGWWKELENPLYRYIMSWVDAIVFAGIAIYFLNNFFFQNFVIPTSSLEKTMLVGDYLCVSKLSYGPAVPRTPLTMPLTQNTMPAILGGGKSYLDFPQWDYRRVKGLGNVQLNDIVVFNFPAGDTVCIKATNPDFRTACYGIGQQILADALNVPIYTMETAGEGGPWGMALLAAYMVRKEAGETLEEYLTNKVFTAAESSTLYPTIEGVAGFESYLKRYKACLKAQAAAADMM